jgi:hypothetical protein
MTDVRSPAAQLGYVDPEVLIHQCAGAFKQARTGDELDDLWRKMVTPVEDQLSFKALGILENIQSLNRTIISLFGRQ